MQDEQTHLAERVPVTAKGRRTRERIIAAAAEVVFERGITATTLDEVKSAAGVSSSQLYHYFRDKEELILAVIRFRVDAAVAFQEAADLSSMRGLKCWADDVVAGTSEQLGKGGCPLSLLANQLIDAGPRGRAEIEHGFRRWADAIAAGLRIMQDRRRLATQSDPDALATAMLASIQGGLLLAQVQQDVAPLRAALDSILALIETQRTHVGRSRGGTSSTRALAAVSGE